MTTQKFRGEYGSPEHKAHIARIAHEHDTYEVIDALCILHDPDSLIEDRGNAARDLEASKELTPAAYAEGLAAYNKAAAEMGIVALKARQRPPFNAQESRIGDVFAKAPPAPPFVVDRLLPRAHGVENAIGGAGKTTRHIWEAVHIILGRDLYGQRVLQSGPVLIVTKEDDLPLFRHRIYAVVGGVEGLTSADRKRIAEHLHVLVLTGTNERLANPDRQGRLEITDLPERIVRGYSQEGLALVDFDPFNMFGPGERFVNDGEAAALSAMANVSQSLHCAVRATSHVSKAVGRDGTSDAHSGRGGSAGGDNSRFVWNYWRHDGMRDKDATVPPELASVADTGDLYRLHIPKLTAARAAWERVWIVRHGFGFTWHADALVTPQARREAAADSDAQRVLDHLRRGREQGGYYTVPELEAEAVTIGIGQKRVRAAVRRLTARGRVQEMDLPPELRKGGRKTHIEPVPDPEVPLDTSRPIVEQIIK